MLFGPDLAKTLVFTQFSACCKKNFFHAKGTTLFSRLASTKKEQKSVNKCPKWTSDTHLGILASFFPTPDFQKRINPSTWRISGARIEPSEPSFCLPACTASFHLPCFVLHLAFLRHRCGQRTVLEGLNTLALKDGTRPEQAAHSAKRCFLNRLETIVASDPNPTFRILILLACLRCQLPTSLLRLLRLAPSFPPAQMRSKVPCRRD